MARVDEFKEKNKSKNKSKPVHAKAAAEQEKVASVSAAAARRPGLEDTAPRVSGIDVDGDPAAETPVSEMPKAEPAPDVKKIELKFQGSELLRAKFPQVFAVAESVATNWMHGGSFDDLPVDNLLVRSLAQGGLLKAKEIEKKVLESPTTEKVAMKAFEIGMEAQKIIESVKKKMHR